MHTATGCLRLGRVSENMRIMITHKGLLYWRGLLQLLESLRYICVCGRALWKAEMGMVFTKERRESKLE